MSWLENPTIAAVLGALTGALATGLISVWIWRSSRTRLRIRAVIRDVTSLLEISENLKSTLNVEIRGKKIQSLFVTSIDVINTGNASIENQNIMIAFPQGTEIIDYSISTTPKIGFEGLNSEAIAHALKVSTKLLNISDKITLEIISTGNSSDEVEVAMRNKDVEEEIVDARTGDFGLSSLLSERNLVMLAIVSTIPFFGGFARSMINVGVANRIDNLSKRKN